MDGSFHLVDDMPIGLPLDGELIRKVFEAVSNHPYASLRSLAQLTNSTKDTVSRILHHCLGMKKYILRWVPHSLTDTQKSERIRIAQQMLQLLQQDEEYDFLHILTGDESWLLYEYSEQSMWAREKKFVPTRLKPGIGTRRVMLITFLGDEDIPIFSLVPRKETMSVEGSATKSCTCILIMGLRTKQQQCWTPWLSSESPPFHSPRIPPT
jgi:hypothetical protein